jgi:peroxiredoxin
VATTSNESTSSAETPKKPSAVKNAVLIVMAGICAAVAAFVVYKQLTDDPYDYGDGPIAFSDSLRSNAELTAEQISALPLTDAQGQPFALRQFRGQKNVVLVFTRGWTSGPPPGAEKFYVGNICLYCATQTARIAANYSQFQDRDAVVVIVFPVLKQDDAPHLADFEKAVRMQTATAELPFPVTLDVDLQAVERLGIRKDLSKPATYILDRDGNVRFAYVGSSLSDRPSVKAMTDQLDAINK